MISACCNAAVESAVAASDADVVPVESDILDTKFRTAAGLENEQMLTEVQNMPETSPAAGTYICCRPSDCPSTLQQCSAVQFIAVLSYATRVCALKYNSLLI